MALINRFTRLFTADLHAVLDRIEEPDTLLKQAVREMEEELTRMQTQARTLRADLERFRSTESELQQRGTELEDELDVCFASGEELLARSLVKRKLEIGRHAKAIAARREATTQACTDLDNAIAENQRHLAGMRQKLELLVEESEHRGAGEHPVGDFTVGNDEIEVAFLREKQRRAGA